MEEDISELEEWQNKVLYREWREIQKQEDPERKNHDLHLICSRCGDEQSCRCNKPKRKFYGLCDMCAGYGTTKKDGNMRGNIEDHPTIKAWTKQAKGMGACIQCQHPWYDGICSCGMAEKKLHKFLTVTLLPLVARLHKEGWLFKYERTVAQRMLKVTTEKETFLPKKKLQKLWE